MTVGQRHAGLLTIGEQPVAEHPGTGWPRQAGRVLVQVVALGLIAVAVAAALPEIRNAFAALADARPALLGVALAFEVAAIAALPQVYRAALRSLAVPLPYRQAIQVSMSAFTLSRALPGGGPAAAIFAARRLSVLGVEGTVATAAVLITGVSSFFALALLAAGGAVLSVLTGHAPGYLAVAGAGGVVLLLVGIAGGWQVLRSAAFRDRLFRLATPLLRRFGDTAKWRTSVDELAAHPPRASELLPVIAWAALAWSLEIAVLWAVFLAFGAWMPLGILVLGWGFANLITGLPHTPGGLGLVETGMAGVYILLGVAASTSIIAVLSYRLFCYWLPMIAGVPLYLRGRRAARP